MVFLILVAAVTNKEGGGGKIGVRVRVFLYGDSISNTSIHHDMSTHPPFSFSFLGW